MLGSYFFETMGSLGGEMQLQLQETKPNRVIFLNYKVSFMNGKLNTITKVFYFKYILNVNGFQEVHFIPQVLKTTKLKLYSTMKNLISFKIVITDSITA